MSENHTLFDGFGEPSERRRRRARSSGETVPIDDDMRWRLCGSQGGATVHLVDRVDQLGRAFPLCGATGLAALLGGLPPKALGCAACAAERGEIGAARKGLR